ncbi:cell wall hydrolase [Paracoccus siganidrum]|uniref:Cell wall hydrolase n=1 Tax=Paracoccus siganidrum TaxID=1276757 RepID=A0A419A602_9RHOB|nr:cell wall hydrolase [Paracoccus siganidrum]RJL13360.1 cell wall hydrolase [Paracoccus siganidrum]RMC31291.1 cell wall hydrolase [Paracoccus siganidrum]
MLQLLPRLAHLCLCAAAITTLATTSADAGGNGSLFSSDAGLLGGVSQPVDSPRATPLLYSDAEPVKVQSEPEQIFLARSNPRFSAEDLACMAEAVYFEARGESRQGQAAVAEVILNRVDSRGFPSTVCGVVNQPAQFSYTIGGRKRITNKAAYLRARDIAQAALSGAPRNLTGGATYFHTPAVRPAWSHRFQRTVQIGAHIFYRSGQRIASN